MNRNKTSTLDGEYLLVFWDKKLHLQDKAVEFRKYLFSFNSNNHVMRDFVMSKIKSFQNLIFLVF